MAAQYYYCACSTDVYKWLLEAGPSNHLETRGETSNFACVSERVALDNLSGTVSCYAPSTSLSLHPSHPSIARPHQSTGQPP